MAMERPSARGDHLCRPQSTHACHVQVSQLHPRSCVETATSLIEATENTEVWPWVANTTLLEILVHTLGSVKVSTPAFLDELMLATDVASCSEASRQGTVYEVHGSHVFHFGPVALEFEPAMQ